MGIARLELYSLACHALITSRLGKSHNLVEKQKKYEFVKDQYQELLRQGVTGSVVEEKKNGVADAKRERDTAQSAIDEHVSKYAKPARVQLTA